MNKDLGNGSTLPDRFTSEDIFSRVLQVADEEVRKGARELFFSALAAGFAITLTFMLLANLQHASGGHTFLSALLYPLGFMYIILGNYQLFTENTLPPVALVLERLASIPTMLTVWSIVLAGNIVGGALGAFFLANTGVFSPEVAEVAVSLSLKALEFSWSTLFFKGAFAGVIVAGVVWLDYAARDTISRVIMIYLAFLAIPLADLFHVVVTATEIAYLGFLGQAEFWTSLYQVGLPVLLGNTVGGVFFVTIVNYFQTPDYIRDDSENRLPLKKWLFSWDEGRDKLLFRKQR